MKYVFVIGAGASEEINMPIGTKLKDDIGGLLSFEKYRNIKGELAEIIGNVFYAISKYEQSSGNVSRGESTIIAKASDIIASLPLAESIDNYINSNRDNKDIEMYCKIGIAGAILRAERDSSLFQPDLNNFDLSKTKGTWYHSLFSKLTNGCTIKQFVERLKEVAFLTFNYDRSLEYFLYIAIRLYFGISQRESWIIINNINIFHAYGQTGFLSFQGGNVSVDYGVFPQSVYLYNTALNIKTFMEGIDVTNEKYQKMLSYLYEADNVIFLGFAYHKQNMDLLYPKIVEKGDKINPSDNLIVPALSTYYGTFFNISDEGKRIIEENIKKSNKRIQGDIKVCSGKCVDLFTQYSYNLNF
jgi:hypothetical protein